MAPSDPHPDRALLARAKTDPRARRALVERLRAMIVPAVRVCLRRWPGSQLAGNDEEDLSAEILLRVLKDDGRALDLWDEQRGTLGNYVSLYTRNRLKELERKELRRLELVPTPIPLADVAEPQSATARPDDLAAAKELAQLLRRCLAAKMPAPKAQRMIELLYDQMLTTDEVVAETGMARDQVFRWRHKIRTTARGCLEEIRDKG